jgi:hypothetical protein
MSEGSLARDFGDEGIDGIIRCLGIADFEANAVIHDGVV